jgi:hypothetical protein
VAYTLDIKETASISLEEFVSYTDGFEDLRDESALCEIAPMFKRLLNNKSFVADAINRELRTWRDFQKQNIYTGQVLLLTSTPTYYLRANIWAPGMDYGDSRITDDRVYSYGIPHDHNFSFLTGGYLGSGYSTTLYEWEDLSARFVGRTAQIHFLEETHLPEGKIMVYRRFWDIHSQGPAEDFSLSINVLPHFASEERQFFLDSDLALISRTGSEGYGSRDKICALAGYINDPSTITLLHDISVSHRDPYLRGSAIEALAKVDKDTAVDAYDRALGSLSTEHADSLRRRLETALG